MNWTILINQDQEKYLEKIKEINNILIKQELKNENIGLLGGISGFALFHTYMYEYQKDDNNIDKIYSIIEDTFDRINNGFSFPALSNGLAGIVWALNHLHRMEYVDREIIEEFNSLDNYIFQSSIYELKQNKYDYLHNGLGTAFTLATKTISDTNISQLNNIIDHLEKIAVKINEKAIAWESKNENISNKNVFNLSLSHGLASIMSVLSLFYMKGIQKDKCLELINKSYNFLIQNENDISKHDHHFQSVILTGEFKPYPRPAWCYGDLGIGISLLNIARRVNNCNMDKKAIEVLLNSTKKKNPQQYGIFDAGLCHGTAGIAHIFNRAYQYTKLEDFKNASIHWFEETFKMAKFEDGLAGYKAYKPGSDEKWENQVGFLEGITGIGLAMISAISDIEPKWDECLLLS